MPRSPTSDQPLLRRNERRLAGGPCEPCTLPVWSAPSVVACVLRLRSRASRNLRFVSSRSGLAAASSAASSRGHSGAGHASAPDCSTAMRPSCGADVLSQRRTRGWVSPNRFPVCAREPPIIAGMGRRRHTGPARHGPDGTSADGVSGVCGPELLRDADRRTAWMLLVDGVPQSHVDLEDPGYLDFEYIRRLGHVSDTGAPPGQPLRVLHLGAGALTLARYVAATRPGSPQLAVEVDGALGDPVRLRLPPRHRRLRVRVGEARAELERLRPGSFDVIIVDVFA